MELRIVVVFHQSNSEIFKFIAFTNLKKHSSLLFSNLKKGRTKIKERKRSSEWNN